MLKKYICLIGILGLENCRSGKPQIIDEYLAVAMTAKSMTNMQESFSTKLPATMPNSIRLKLTAFSKRVWDFSSYTESLNQSEIPQNILSSMSSTIEFGMTSLGKAVAKSLQHFYENDRLLLSSKKISDFPAKRIEIFQTRFLSPENIANTKRINRDLNLRIMKIFWIVSHPNKLPNESEILTKAQQIIDADEARLNGYVKQKKAPDSAILRSLVRTMLLSDEELESYLKFSDTDENKKLEQFFLDFDHNQTVLRMDKYMKSL